jgi:hypothetical protein
LCHEDGKLWSAVDLEDSPAERTDSVVDESGRAEYLNCARETLQRRGPDL